MIKVWSVLRLERTLICCRLLLTSLRQYEATVNRDMWVSQSEMEFTKNFEFNTCIVQNEIQYDIMLGLKFSQMSDSEEEGSVPIYNFISKVKETPKFDVVKAIAEHYDYPREQVLFTIHENAYKLGLL